MLMASTMQHYVVLLCIIFLLLAQTFSSSQGTPDQAAILLKFKDSLQNVTALDSWNKSTSICNSSSNSSNWKGIVCKNNDVAILQIEGLGLHGTIDIDSLAHLPNLHQLSVMNNNFVGAMPAISKLVGLRALYLANNGFSGDILDDAFEGMDGIRRIVLANNSFTGKIPKSLTQLGKLVDLQLQSNQFTGEIPNFTQKSFVVNVAYNDLEGEIPKDIGIRQNSTLFEGNAKLCGLPLKPCKSSKHHILSKTTIVLAAIAGAVVLVLFTLGSFVFYRSRVKASEHEKSTFKNTYQREPAQKADMKETKAPDQIAKHSISEARNLHFVIDGREKFELEDLLRASAQVLGSGNFGSSYKADLQFGQSMVVKRFKEMKNVGKEKFFEHMTKLGKLSHPNVLPLVAFHYRNEDKLLVTDFAEFGSLASHLHSTTQGPNQSGLTWPTRLKIIKGIAKGLDYLHMELSHLTLPHGHLKASNVVLDSKFEPLLSDYALAPMINKDHVQQFMVAYKSPEFLQHGRVTLKAEVWSLGILILELLTGRFPVNYIKEGKGVNEDLAAWVQSVVSEEWTCEVFDKDMNETRNAEGQMLRLLKIGMCCCEESVEKRWDLKEAVKRIEELKEKDSDEDFSDYGSEGDMYSSKAMTDDDFSFSSRNVMKLP